MENTMVTMIIKRWDFDLGRERELCAHCCCILFQFIETVSDGISVSSEINVSLQDPQMLMQKKWIFSFSWLISHLSLMFCKVLCNEMPLCTLVHSYVHCVWPLRKHQCKVKTGQQLDEKHTHTYRGPLQICIWSHPHISSQNPVTHIHAQTHQACSWEHLELESIGSQTTMLAVNQSRRRQI